MGREPSQGADDGDGRPGRRRPARGESHEWNIRGDAAPHSLPYRRRAEVQRSGAKTSSRAGGDSSFDASDLTMPPPRRASSPADAYRRPRGAVVYEEEHVSGRRHSRRDWSPTDEYRRRRHAEEYSEPSLAPSSRESAYDDREDGSESESSSDHLIVDEADDEASRERQLRLPAPEGYMESSEERRRRRRREHGRRHSDSEERRRRTSTSDHDSPVRRPRAYESTHETSRSPHKTRRHHPNVIENSRPPVASKRLTNGPANSSSPRHSSKDRSSKREKDPSEVTYHDSRPRRSKTLPSSRSSNRSNSNRPPSILGGIFKTPSVRRTSPEKPPVKLVECVICMGDVAAHKVAKLKCGHNMCNSCLERSFKLSITDPQHMPPKCCSTDHIPLKHVERIFDTSFKKTWNRKFSEYTTRNRIYCPSKKCGEWIKPGNVQRENGRKVARCGRCKTKVCPSCNSRWHSSIDCPKDEETNKLLEQARDEGWQRCYRCKAMVELKEGCNHMTCRCGAEFCMICGIKWKGCDCPWFNYDNNDRPEMNIPVPIPGIRGDMHDIFGGHGPPLPPELRRPGFPGRIPPHGYAEEMHHRRLQEEQDEDLARRLMMYGDIDDNDDMDDSRGHGNMVGIGNASGHFMNEDFRRGGHRAMPPAPGSPGYDRAPDYVTDINRARGMRGGSMERRLADRLSEHRRGMPPLPGPLSPHQVPPLLGNPMAIHMGMGMAMPAPPPPPVPMLRPPLAEDDLYSNAASIPRSERVVPGRVSRRYEDEAEVHAPRSRRSREEPKGSAMAGLNGRGRGMNRVFEWRGYVEPGVPEGEATSTVGS